MTPPLSPDPNRSSIPIVFVPHPSQSHSQQESQLSQHQYPYLHQQQQQQQQQQRLQDQQLDSSSFQLPSPSQSHSHSHSHPEPPEFASASCVTPVAAVASRSNTNSSTIGTGDQKSRFTEEWGVSVRGSPVTQEEPRILSTTTTNQDNTNLNTKLKTMPIQRSTSVASRRSSIHTVPDGASVLTRGNTLKKKASLRRSGSRSSRRSMRAGSVKSLVLDAPRGSSAATVTADEAQSVFFSPLPLSGSPTDTLAGRFQTWRKVLKDLISVFREMQSQHEHRAKSMLKLANVLGNTQTPVGLLADGERGIGDALGILREYHQRAVAEAHKARDMEEDIILALTGLRSDLGQKMKEIKNLSGDFKNNVAKEMDQTKRTVNALQEALGQSELDSSQTTGKQDPYLLRLAVDRQVGKQLDEENYLHQAYLNLETSGCELETIVVGEIQKAYNAYAGILKREADADYVAVDLLREGPIAMPRDHEWKDFIARDARFVDPDMAIRSVEHLNYPGQDHYACQEIRAGLLERKSKYLKSYAAGWYVLSSTHLHEFKSADKTQAPVMSLYLPEQKLGSHSASGVSSNKFILKGRQTGAMHRGHTWVFRAESHDTMMAWYEDIQALTEKTPEERSTYLRDHQQHQNAHTRTQSRSSLNSSDGVDDDDDPPFVSSEKAAAVVAGGRSPRVSRHISGDTTMTAMAGQNANGGRPSPGGRFPSDLQVNAERGLQVQQHQQQGQHPPVSPSSVSSGPEVEHHNNIVPASAQQHHQHQHQQQQQYPQHQHHQHDQYHQPSQQQVSNGTPVPAGASQPLTVTMHPADYDAIVAAGGLPGSGVGDPPDSAARAIGQTYGNTSTVALDDAPSKATMRRVAAEEDGVNPYFSGESSSQPQRGEGYSRWTSESGVNGEPGGYVAQSSGQQQQQQQQHQVRQQERGGVRGNGGNGMRPVQGGRMDSTPHVPGEFPKSPAVNGVLGEVR